MGEIVCGKYVGQFKIGVQEMLLCPLGISLFYLKYTEMGSNEPT